MGLEPPLRLGLEDMISGLLVQTLEHIAAQALFVLLYVFVGLFCGFWIVQMLERLSRVFLLRGRQESVRRTDEKPDAAH